MRGDGFFVSSKKRGRDGELSGKCSLVHPFTSDVIVVMLEDKVVDAFFLTIANVCKQTVATTKQPVKNIKDYGPKRSHGTQILEEMLRNSTEID